jgi:hypothetical protein
MTEGRARRVRTARRFCQMAYFAFLLRTWVRPALAHTCPTLPPNLPILRPDRNLIGEQKVASEALITGLWTLITGIKAKELEVLLDRLRAKCAEVPIV